MKFSKQIAKNNAKVRARRNMETLQGAAFERDRIQRQIERGQRFFWTTLFFALVAYIAVALVKYGNLIIATIVSSGAA